MSITKNTICAISSASGIGAIAIIRLSGENVFEITSKILKKKDKFLSIMPKKLFLDEILDKDNNLIDQVLITKFVEPHSFTGENMLEIYCHGSIFIQNKILQLLIENGATTAKPGEFSQRAFFNGKMDLSQVEAISDLIVSQTAASHYIAITQMKGGFKKELDNMRKNLLNFVSLIELELDFSEEDVEFADRSALFNLANTISQKINKLIYSFKVGNVIKNGMPIAIVGKTNVGKSSLLNLLLKEERAIVSEIHGTTRDSIEDTIVIDGINFRFIDTAGIRTTIDIVENLGIKKTYNQINNSEIILILIDINDNIDNIENFILEQSDKINFENKKIFYVFNKIDLSLETKQNEIKSLKILKNKNIIFISVKENKIENLIKKLVETAKEIQNNDSDIIITNSRHYEALLKAEKAIENVILGLKNNISGDFISQDIRECMHYIGEITGEFSNDEILENIFKNFCIGK